MPAFLSFCSFLIIRSNRDGDDADAEPEAEDSIEEEIVTAAQNAETDKPTTARRGRGRPKKN